MARPLDCLIGLGLNPSPYDEARAEAAALRKRIEEHNDMLSVELDDVGLCAADFVLDVSDIPVTP